MNRVSIDPTDPDFNPDARVFSRNREVLEWAEADVFRRVVVLKGGAVLNGSVRIQLAPEAPAAPLTSMQGLFEPEPKAPEAPEALEAPAATDVPTPAVEADGGPGAGLEDPGDRPQAAWPFPEDKVQAE